MDGPVLVKQRNGVCWITLNRAKQLNALNYNLYESLIAAIDKANRDKDVKLTVITGNGRYFTAGNDFFEIIRDNPIDPESDDYAPFKHLIDRLIRHDKPLIALVNGPAVGLGVTILGLCDAVFATESATFWTPFTDLGLCPEACSSYVFPSIMGYQKAARMALFAEKLTAAEACEAGLVTKVIPDALFNPETEAIIVRYSKLSAKSLLVSKRLMRPINEVEKLLTINRQEYEGLMVAKFDEDTVRRISEKFSKSKL